MTTELITNCTCEAPGYCQRHGIDKPKRLWELCRSRLDYFNLWETGNSPQHHYKANAAALDTAPRGPVRTQPCVYLGRIHSRTDPTGQECQCPHKWLRACEVHSECTLTPCGRDGVSNCLECDDYESDAVEPAAENSTLQN